MITWKFSLENAEEKQECCEIDEREDCHFILSLPQFGEQVVNVERQQDEEDTYEDQNRLNSECQYRLIRREKIVEANNSNFMRIVSFINERIH